MTKVESVLFPRGAPRKPTDLEQTLELYKLMVASSEALVSRRQGLNTYFLTLHGALVSATAFVLGARLDNQLRSVGLSALMIVGIILAVAWALLLISFGQLNTGKFEVINAIEKRLPASVFSAEWVALGEGKDPKKYRSFTKREVWVPRTFVIIYAAGLSLQILSLTHLVNLAQLFSSS